MCCFRKFLFLCKRELNSTCILQVSFVSSTHTYIYIIYCLPVHVCMHMQEICTNLNINFKLSLFNWVASTPREKILQNPKQLDVQRVDMDVKKCKP